MLNETIIAAIIQTALNGECAIIVHKQPLGVINQLAGQIPSPAISRIRRSNGHEGIDLHSGGSIRVHRYTSRMRGTNADTLVVPVGMTEDQRMDAIPTTSTTNGTILGYY